MFHITENEENKKTVFEFVEGYDLDDQTDAVALLFDAPIITLTGELAKDSLDGFNDYLDYMLSEYTDHRVNAGKESIKLEKEVKKEIEVLPEVNPLFGSW